MNPHNRSRQDYYGDESRPQDEYYPSAAYAAQRLPYPDNAATHLYQQHDMLAQLHRNGHGMSQYAQEDLRYQDRMQQNDFNNVAQPTAYYKNTQSPQEGVVHGRERMQDTRDDQRYAERFEPHSGTTIGETRTSTERTRSTPVQTSSTRSSSSRYGSSSTSSSESDEEINWEENIMSALNDMAGNLKKIGGIRCNQAGPDTTEVQVKLNLPLPIDNLNVGFNNAMASLSPKNCRNMQYDYSHLDSHVVDMEEKFLGTMDQIQGNMMPVYKSLFHSQSESSDDLDDDESESTYEDQRFLSNVVAPNLKQQQQQYETTNVVTSPIRMKNEAGIPLQIIVSNEPSCVSSTDSWKLSSPRDELRRNPNKSTPNNVMTTTNYNLDVAVRGSRRVLEVEDLGNPQMGKKAKSNPEIPQIVDVNAVPECYSDLTTGVRMSTEANAERERSTSNVPAIKTQFSGDEIMERSKASFQRNSMKKGIAFNPDLNEPTEDEDVVVKSDPPATMSPSSRSLHARKALHKNEAELEEKRQLDEEREKEEEEERKQREAKAKKSLGKKRLEERVEAELKSAREVLRTKKLEAAKKQREAEAKAAEQQALEFKRLEEEEKQREAEAKIAEEAQKVKRLEEERERVEAEAKAQQEVYEAKRQEGERKQREAEEKAAEEARKAKMLEKERKRIEAETKAAQEALEELYAKKTDEERRQRRKAAMKEEEERKQLEAEAKVMEAKKLKGVRERVEAEAQAADVEAKKFEEERKKIEAETKAVEKELKGRKLKKQRKSIESQKNAQPEKGRASLYKVQGFDDYCKSVASFQIDDGKAMQTDSDSSDEEASRAEERSASSILDSDVSSEEKQQSSLGEQSYSSNSVETYSSDEESEIFTDTTSFVEDSDSTSDVHSTNTTERLRNNIDYESQNFESKRTHAVNNLFSSEESVHTMDRTVRSFLTKESAGSSKSKLPLKSPKKLSSYTSDVPIPIAATMSTLQTFDQGTVYSGQHSLGRFIKSSDGSVVSSASYSNQSVISAKPVALPVTPLPRDTKKSKIKSKSRSSIVGSIISSVLALALRIIFTIILFSYTWMKHLVITIGKKRAAKLDCTPTQFAMQPDQAIRREEIQDRSTDSRIHQNTIQPYRNAYLGYEDPDQEHYTTTMIMKPPVYLADDSDEVGTCVESIVPDAHYPNMSDGKMSTWKITQKNTETSSLSSPPSSSYRVLKSAYSALSAKRESEKSNWMDQPTIDDEMSYYE